jgi:predicted transcriptional regulator
MAQRYPEHRGAIDSARRPAHALEDELAEALGVSPAEVVELLRAAWQAGAPAA